MPDLNVEWTKDADGLWFNLYDIDFAQHHFDDLAGVYIVWHGGHDGPNCLKTGKGNIRNCLLEQRKNPLVDACRDKSIFVTWAIVPTDKMEDIAAYLAHVYEPLLAEKPEDQHQISVNLP